MSLLALIPIRDWLYLAAVTAVIACAALFVHHERDVGAAKVEAVRQTEHAQAASVAASAIAANQTETARREAAIQEIVHATQDQAARVAADASAAGVARDALRVQLAATVAAARRARPTDPGSTAASAPAGDPIGVLADVFSRADDRATELARIADERGTAGAACVSAYSALTP